MEYYLELHLIECRTFLVLTNSKIFKFLCKENQGRTDIELGEMKGIYIKILSYCIHIQDDC